MCLTVKRPLTELGAHPTMYEVEGIDERILMEISTEDHQQMQENKKLYPAVFIGGSRPVDVATFIRQSHSDLKRCWCYLFLILGLFC